MDTPLVTGIDAMRLTPHGELTIWFPGLCIVARADMRMADKLARMADLKVHDVVPNISGDGLVDWWKRSEEVDCLAS